MTNTYPGSSVGGDFRKHLDSAYSEHDNRVVNFNPGGVHSSRGQGGYRNSGGSHYRGGHQSYRPSHLDYSEEIFRHPDNMRKYGNKAKHNRKSHSGRGIYSRSNRGGSSVTFSDDEDMGDMTQPGQSRNKRFSPYGSSSRSSRGGGGPYLGVSQNSSQFKRRLGGPRNRSSFDNYDRYAKLGGGPNAWFKITVPHGGKETEHYLLSSLLNITETPFVPKEYHTEGANAVFYIQGSQPATALKACSRRITNARGFKIVVIVNPSDPPVSEKVTPEIMEKLKICMSNRYDASTKSLNLSSLEKDEDLNKENIRLVFGKLAIMKDVFNIIQENIPELEALDIRDNKLGSLAILEKYFPSKAPNVVRLNLGNNTIKSISELSRFSSVPLVELTLDGNPLCDHYSNKEAYVSAIRKKFPKLQKLDGQDLPPMITFELSNPVTLPHSQGSFLGSNKQVQVTVTQFVQQYFTVYDGTDRQALLEAYVDEAIFSLVCSRTETLTTNRALSLNLYLEKSHNLLRPSGHASKMKCGRIAVVSLHSELPRTEHDLNSLLIDIHLLSQTMLIFSVQGVFREPVTAAPVALTPDQKRLLIEQFSKQSGMNSDWSARCLEENSWNFEAAAKIFTDLRQVPDQLYVLNTTSFNAIQKITSRCDPL
ncbi:hypothetical protein LSH36_151g02042 [Paralvinella palmiformis]|uniref:Nuclear RNA export factor 1 n=1 Tax=Paralvinella palmiformis TaxID=53620 RepID=A0AAD9JUB1_9ANNE|nr:hypothetical protein LSH36_151g02042 [Paralvinella palmiformis]